MCKVSVIIPCYNSAEYIEKCLKSFERQSFSDFEIIIVDDCSEDNTVEVISRFIRTSKLRIRQIYNDYNYGPSKSRYNGVQCANGQYITFCDSDDWYEPDYIESMYQKITEEKADIIIANYYNVSSRGNRRKKIVGYKKTVSSRDALTINVDSLCIMFFKKQLFEDVAFPDIRNGEDMAIIPVLLFRSTRIGFVNKCLYNYQYRENSVSNSFNGDEVRFMRMSFQYVEENIPDEYYEETEYIGIRNLIYGGLLCLFKFSNNKVLADEILDDFTTKYPGWINNQYLRYLPFYKRIFVRTAYKRNYFILRLLCRMHSALTGRRNEA